MFNTYHLLRKSTDQHFYTSTVFLSPNSASGLTECIRSVVGFYEGSQPEELILRQKTKSAYSCPKKKQVRKKKKKRAHLKLHCGCAIFVPPHASVARKNRTRGMLSYHLVSKIFLYKERSLLTIKRQ
jgi:hypothetical protein